MKEKLTQALLDWFGDEDNLNATAWCSINKSEISFDGDFDADKLAEYLAAKLGGE